MRLDVPVSVLVTGLVVLGAGNLDLLETPLGEVDIASAKITSQDLVLQAERGGKSADLASVTRGGIADNFNLPVILLVANGQISVRRYLLVSLGDRGGDLVRVQVAAGLGMEKADGLAISDEARISFGIVVGISSVEGRVECGAVWKS